MLGLLIVVMFALAACAGSTPPCTGKFVQVPPAVAAPAPVAVAPAPKAVVPAPVVKAAPDPIVIYFDFDKATLKASEKAKVDQAVKLMKSDPTALAEIDGHTDPIGTSKYNMALGHARANAVKAALAAQGIDAKRVTVKSFGETKLVKPDAKGIIANQPNRRAVVIIKIK